MNDENRPDWWIFRGEGKPHDAIRRLPDPPPWREFREGKRSTKERGELFQPEAREIELVNAALYLRRPLLVTGKPGLGKTTLAYAVAHELKLGKVLRWSVTTRTSLRDGLYLYDAVGRLQETSLRGEEGNRTPPPINHYLQLGPLGTAFADSLDHPRVLLIDEIDKSDVDLPNDLLHIFEEGEFDIPELARMAKVQDSVQVPLYKAKPGDAMTTITQGQVRCHHFPLVILTSNGEREFPPAFLRRCLRLDMAWPENKEEKKRKLIRIVEAHLGLAEPFRERIEQLLDNFIDRLHDQDAEITTDQLLNSVFLAMKDIDPEASFPSREALLEALWRSISA